MYTRKVKRLPAADPNGHLAGIISRAGVLSVSGRPDGDIRREIRDEVIQRELSTDPAAFTVIVKDGIVTLGGIAETSEFGDEIVQRVRHVQRAVAVRDRLAYPHAEPPGEGFDVLANFPAG